MTSFSGGVTMSQTAHASCGSRMILTGLCLAVLSSLIGCSQQVACDDQEVVDKMLALARSDAASDLANQCASRLYARIPSVAPKCPTDADGLKAGCATACMTWADSHVTAKANRIETLFKDDLVVTRRCRADVRFDVAFDGGQTVDARVTYLAAPKLGGPQVVLSD